MNRRKLSPDRRQVAGGFGHIRPWPGKSSASGGAEDPPALTPRASAAVQGARHTRPGQHPVAGHQGRGAPHSVPAGRKQPPESQPNSQCLGHNPHQESVTPRTQRKTAKAADVGPNASVITLNANVPNVTIRKQRLTECVRRKHDSTIRFCKKTLQIQ